MDHSLERRRQIAGLELVVRGVRRGQACELERPRVNASEIAFLLLVIAATILWVRPARAQLDSHEPSRFLPMRTWIGDLWRGQGPIVLAQRAIQDKKKPAEETPPPPADSPGTPPAESTAAPAEGTAPAGTPAEGAPAGADGAETQSGGEVGHGAPREAVGGGDTPPSKEVILSDMKENESVERKSPARAFLLSAALPGLGEFYSGSNRGYLFLGVEAVSWITYASYRTSSNDKEGEMFDFADDHFSIEAFERDCVSQPGQPCQTAVLSLREFYERDRPEFYEIISKNPIYRTGWGVVVDENGFTYENCAGEPPGTCPPEEGTEAYRQWVANQAASQDRGYASYNELRDDRNSLSRTARGMTMVALINHVVSAWDAFITARGVNAVAEGLRGNMDVGGDIQMGLKVKGSLDRPEAAIVLRRSF
jgi:hypothetical protein